jgi:hypothetical protein
VRYSIPVLRLPSFSFATGLLTNVGGEVGLD